MLQDLRLLLEKVILVLRDLDRQIVLLLLDLGFLAFHDVDEELLFEARECHCEVDNSQLDAYLGKVVRVGQLGRDQQPEIVVVEQALPLATKVDLLDTVLLVDRLHEYRIEAGVQILAHLFVEHGMAMLNSQLKLLLRRISLLHASFAFIFVLRCCSVDDDVLYTLEIGHTERLLVTDIDGCVLSPASEHLF